MGWMWRWKGSNRGRETSGAQGVPPLTEGPGTVCTTAQKLRAGWGGALDTQTSPQRAGFGDTAATCALQACKELSVDWWQQCAAHSWFLRPALTGMAPQNCTPQFGSAVLAGVTGRRLEAQAEQGLYPTGTEGLWMPPPALKSQVGSTAPGGAHKDSVKSWHSCWHSGCLLLERDTVRMGV